MKAEIKKIMKDNGCRERTAYRIAKKERPEKPVAKKEESYVYSKGKWV